MENLYRFVKSKNLAETSSAESADGEGGLSVAIDHAVAGVFATISNIEKELKEFWGDWLDQGVVEVFQKAR